MLVLALALVSVSALVLALVSGPALVPALVDVPALVLALVAVLALVLALVTVAALALVTAPVLGPAPASRRRTPVPARAGRSHTGSVAAVTGHLLEQRRCG